MILEPLAPGDDERLTTVARLPDETLYQYLVRSQCEMAGRIRLLAAGRDAYMAILNIERSRWWRRMFLLALAEPVIAALVYIGLASSGMVEEAPAPLIAGLIALAALVGGLLTFSMTHIGEILSSWLCSRRRP